jgi:hypothetical protein
VDVAQVTELRQWATRLEDASTEELRAAGRAIRMLVDEVEGLQAKLVEAEAGAPPPVTAPSPEATPEATDPPWAAAADERTQGSFRSRLKRSLGVD